MKTTKTLGFILIVISLLTGYIGFNKVADSTKEINLLGLKIAASDQSAKQEGYLYVGAAILLFAGGLFAVNKSNK